MSLKDTMEDWGLNIENEATYDWSDCNDRNQDKSTEGFYDHRLGNAALHASTTVWVHCDSWT